MQVQNSPCPNTSCTMCNTMTPAVHRKCVYVCQSSNTSRVSLKQCQVSVPKTANKTKQYVFQVRALSPEWQQQSSRRQSRFAKLQRNLSSVGWRHSRQCLPLTLSGWWRFPISCLLIYMISMLCFDARICVSKCNHNYIPTMYILTGVEVPPDW